MQFVPQVTVPVAVTLTACVGVTAMPVLVAEAGVVAAPTVVASGWVPSVVHV